jgi:ABC-type uncharacterized transport system substrate-binding protein
VKFLTLLLLSFGIASAHPHLFIDISLNMLFAKDKSLQTMDISWKFDDMNSEILIMDYDKNMNGEFDRDETDFFKQELFETLMKEYNYYTLMKIGGRNIPMEKVLKSIIKFHLFYRKMC